uniref:Uncharacterized protein n=1 Tax=Anopheles farauti TaxID=69004 RepID=A0A182QJR6_9DIPT
MARNYEITRIPTIPEGPDGSECLEDTQPPSELFRSIASPPIDASLLKATIDGHECRLPFEVLQRTPTYATIPHLDETSISRQPFQCPAGHCQQLCCLFMFATHVTFDHKDVLVEMLWPDETNTVLVDPHAPDGEDPRCHKLYLVSGKIRGLGDGKHRDKLPFALMSSKFTLNGTRCLLLWITGPDAGGSLRQRYTMEAGRNDPSRLLPYAVAFSGEIVPLHDSQDADVIHRAGAGLVIPEQQLHFLTHNRTKLLEVCVHFYR